MNRSKKIIYAFFISAALMNNKFSSNIVQAAGTTVNPQGSAYVSSANIFTKYGYKGQCTWFAYGRTLEKLQIALPSEFYGNAVEWWYANARDKVYPYGTEPKPNSIAVWAGGNYGYGHVGFVENVEGNTVYFTEGNFSVRGAYDGSVKAISREEIKKRGNLYLKGYIYLGEGKSQPTYTGSPSTTPSRGETSTQKEPVIDKGTVNISSSGSVLNVRNISNGYSNVIGSLRKGENVEIVGKSGDWYKIKFNSSYGYVSSKYINTNGQAGGSGGSNPVSPSNTSNTLKSGIIFLSNKSSSLNLRTAPNGSIISSLGHGTKVDILESNGSWYKVKANGVLGYVSSSYINVSQITNSTTNTTVASSGVNSATADKVGIVVLGEQSSTLNLRNNPWTGRVISTLSSGTKVEVLGNNGRWYKVKAGSEVGYVHSDYIKL